MTNTPAVLLVASLTSAWSAPIPTRLSAAVESMLRTNAGDVVSDWEEWDSESIDRAVSTVVSSALARGVTRSGLLGLQLLRR